MNFWKILYTLGSLTYTVSLCRSDSLRIFCRPHQSLNQFVQYSVDSRDCESARVLLCHWSLWDMDGRFHLYPCDTRQLCKAVGHGGRISSYGMSSKLQKRRSCLTNCSMCAGWASRSPDVSLNSVSGL